MNNKVWIATIICALSLCMVRLGFCSRGTDMINSSHDINKLKQWFAIEPEEIRNTSTLFMNETSNLIQKIVDIAPSDRTYQNTIIPFDHLCSKSNLTLFSHLCSILESVSPRKDVRDAAHETIILIQAFFVDKIGSNKHLYQALRDYASLADTSSLKPEEHYFISEALKDYERQGLSLPDDQLNAISLLKKEIASLAVQFERNIAEDMSSISVTKDELAGLDEEFISRLSQNTKGLYILGVDYPTFFGVMENCTVESTRKQLSRAFNNRAYPMNDTLLKEILIKRHELAQRLGFKDYAHLDLADQMAKHPDQVAIFLQDLNEKSKVKAMQELQTWTQELPESVSLRTDGKLDPWNMSFVQASYKKKHFNIDERKIAEYFPLEETIKGLFTIYESFFNISLKKIPVNGMWHPDVLCIQLYDKKEEILFGTIFLDLFPREGKFTHAAQASFIPALINENGERHPGAVVVMANFPKPTAETPALLQRNDVSTFFHEFGHALHSLFGATEIASFSGTHVKRDFVELPSQMLEEWLWNRDILKMISSHYLTKAPLDDETIDNILALKNNSSGSFLQRQVWLSTVALRFHQQEQIDSLFDLFKEAYESIITTTAFDDENHMYANFGHLCGYDAKYYGYMWSKVFALDLFDTIKSQGLLNPEIGCRYAECVLSKGGTEDPNNLLEAFLSRKPESTAFFKDMGL